ncbi:siphovirus ReqiPepy6 Gp37-like family protein [Bifidobacterium longum]|uniref:siphovirus ReqiPepy6 Gp37-like family protein n=1 Tax=Bifidobacterium longum TaxID=216816 RepID=UPI001C2424C5|nr:siphovirus ReqiPepy6 Gp37-like family protein [Bifidobacterium longum]MBU9069977.1 siphovirus ReqiPepy6 Gp37-like family protein [Bifidobacterium longum]
MVELIITDSNHVDARSAADYTLDCAWGKEENDFELVVSGASTIDAGAYIYIDGSECGGVVDAMEDQLAAGVSTLTYSGRTWHGMLANKILEPDKGKDYLTVSGTASTVIGSLISRVGLDSVFDAVVPPDGSGDPSIKQYQFDRYVDAYTGLRKMCAANGLKLRLAYTSGQVNIWAEPVAHYGDSIDSDLIDFDATRTWRKPNHLIGLGKGELRNRIVSHWYADSKGNVTQTQTFKGLDEIAQVYDYSSAEADELAKNTKKKLQDLQSEGEVKVTVHEDSGIVFDVGDTVTARDNLTGITVNATISKKIVKVSGGVMSVDYEAE